MKTRKILLGILCCVCSLAASAQQLGDGCAPAIENYNTNIPSGYYSSNKKQIGFPDFVGAPYAENWTYLINVSRNDPTHQWQIATPWSGDDRIFFRKIFPITGGTNTPWNELATRSKNIFTDNQFLSSVGEYGTTTIGQYTPKLYFGGQFDNSDDIFIARYNTADNNSHLRIFMGDDNSGDDSFRIGNMASYDGNWRSFITVLNNSKVGIGVENPQNALDVNGTIRAKEIIVETFGADFVFESDYKLKSLSEVKSHIEENKHLPDIPSAAQMQENGIGVSELSIKLLQKIEELTLYAIQQNETIEKLNKRIDELGNNKK